MISSDTLEHRKAKRRTLVADDLVHFSSGESSENILGLLML